MKYEYRGEKDLDKTVKMMRALSGPFKDGKHIVTMKLKEDESDELCICFLNCETGEAKYLQDFGIKDRALSLEEARNEGASANIDALTELITITFSSKILGMEFGNTIALLHQVQDKENKDG